MITSPHIPCPQPLTQSFSLIVALTRPPMSAYFPLSYPSLSLSLPAAQAFSHFSLLCLHCVPICVTHEACLRVKNKRWKENRRTQGERDWWLEVRIWRGEVGALACRRKVINPSISSCLFMYLFSSPSPLNVVPLNAFCQAVSVVDIMKVSESWVMGDNGQHPQQPEMSCISIFTRAEWRHRTSKTKNVSLSKRLFHSSHNFCYFLCV